MSELEEFSVLVGDIYDASLDPTLRLVVQQMVAGADATAAFTDRFKNGDGGILDIIKVPLSNPDFAPFLQYARSDDEDTFSHHSA
jgi:branched-chain amino acid transport system substrate-binding protein